MPAAATRVSFGALAIERPELEATKASEDGGLLECPTKATLMEQNCAGWLVAECGGGLQERNHVAAQRLLPTNCSLKMIEHEVDEVRCVPCDRVALHRSWIRWIPTSRIDEERSLVR